MLQQFLRTATDGWDAAMASIRNLFAEGDLRADEVGGDFAAEAARLGESLAEVHHDLAEHFPTHVRTAAEQRELAAAMNARLDAALEVVPDLSAYGKACAPPSTPPPRSPVCWCSRCTATCTSARRCAR